VSRLQLPIPIVAFLRAANSHDTTALLATLAGDAVVSDLGREIRGAELRSWSDALFVKSRLAVRPIEVTERDDSTVVSVVIHGTKPGARKHIRRDWWFTVDRERIAALETVPAKEPDLPPPVAGFVRSTNAGDLEALMAGFAEGAMVNDDLLERWGKAAIRKWAEHEFIGERVSIFVVACIEHHRSVIVNAHVDGDFDQRGLPYPLVLTFYFSTEGDRIVQLIILRNEPD
jgi:hypothetical protein